MNRHLVSEEGREEHSGRWEQHVQKQGHVLAELCSQLSITRGQNWDGRKALNAMPTLFIEGEQLQPSMNQ